jgi:hypothetical protein
MGEIATEPPSEAGISRSGERVERGDAAHTQRVDEDGPSMMQFTSTIFATSLAASLVGGAAAAPVDRALLVGVSADGWPALAAEGDIGRLDQTLAELGVPQEARWTLTGDAATRDAVLSGLDALAETVTLGQRVIVHWSGHGARVLDDNGDESDGFDEVWVTAGVSPGSPDGGIRDDALDLALRQLRVALGPDGTLVVTVDACFAAGTLRGASGAVQGDDEAVDLAPSSPELAPMVVLSAAAAHQQARDVLGPKGERAGAFSLALAQTLGDRPSPPTWHDLHARLRGRLARLAPGQLPQLDGDGARALERHDRPAVDWTSLSVVGVLADGRLRLDGGALLGLAPGARVRVSGVAGSNLGEVVAVSAASAWVALDQPDDAVAPGAAVAVLSLPPNPDAGTIALVGGDPAWRADRAARAQAAGLAVLEGPIARGLQPGGVEIDRVYGAGGSVEVRESDLDRHFRRVAAADRALTTPLNGAAFAVEASLVAAEPGTCRVTGGLPVGVTGVPVAAVGQAVGLTVAHVGAAPAFLTVVVAEPGETARQLYPLPGAPREALSPDASWTLPICWAAAHPVGLEHLRVLASRQPLDLRASLEGQALRGPLPDAWAVDLPLLVVAPLAGRSP